MRSPFSSEALAELDHGGLGGVVGALLLRMQHAHSRDRGKEDNRTGRLAVDHGASAHRGNEERAREVDIDQLPEERGGVGFRFDIGTKLLIEFSAHGSHS